MYHASLCSFAHCSFPLHSPGLLQDFNVLRPHVRTELLSQGSILAIPTWLHLPIAKHGPTFNWKESLRGLVRARQCPAGFDNTVNVVLVGAGNVSDLAIQTLAEPLRSISTSHKYFGANVPVSTSAHHPAPLPGAYRWYEHDSHGGGDGGSGGGGGRGNRRSSSSSSGSAASSSASGQGDGNTFPVTGVARPGKEYIMRRVVCRRRLYRAIFWDMPHLQAHADVVITIADLTLADANAGRISDALIRADRAMKRAVETSMSLRSSAGAGGAGAGVGGVGGAASGVDAGGGTSSSSSSSGGNRGGKPLVAVLGLINSSSMMMIHGERKVPLSAAKLICNQVRIQSMMLMYGGVDADRVGHS